jgi:ABC-type transporter Mla MlaB component
MDSHVTSIRTQDDGPNRTIHLHGPLDLPNVRMVHRTLMDALNRPGESGRWTLINLSALTRVDLAGLQLLCSGHRTAVFHGDNLKIQAPDWFHEASSSAGFDQRRSTCPYRRDGNCLWHA